MSEVVLSGPSAYTVYRAIRQAGATITPAVLHKSARVPTSEEQKQLATNYYYKLPFLEVLLADANERRCNCDVRQCFYSRGSYGIVDSVNASDPYFLPGETLIVSPAFMVAQFANTWDLASLLKLALWLGGTYTLASQNESAEQGLDEAYAAPISCSCLSNDQVLDYKAPEAALTCSDYPYASTTNCAMRDAAFSCNWNYDGLHDCSMLTDVKPLLTRRQLNRMVATLDSQRWAGIAKLRQVAKLFCEGAASPKESELFVKLVLPKKFGGLGLSGLQMNKKVEFSSDAYKIAGQSYARVDFLHVGAKVAIEYDSRQHHSQVEQSQRDKRRRGALERDGYKCFSIVPQQIADRAVFNACAAPIVKAIKGRCRASTTKFDLAQRELFRKLRNCTEF